MNRSNISNARSLAQHGCPSKDRGFTLIELLIAVAVSAVLAGLSFPSFQEAFMKARRTDAWTSVMQIQMAQERYRAHRISYGSLDALAQRGTSSRGHYQLSVSHLTDSGYRIQAKAQGLQRWDTACRHLQLRVEGLNHIQESGPTEVLGNSRAQNKKCWGL